MTVMATAERELEEAASLYREAIETENVARRAASDALNRLTEAQRNFDGVVEAIKKQSPGGDWKRTKGVPA